jgi:RNA polymerase sigma factor (sigma-70 family)
VKRTLEEWYELLSVRLRSHAEKKYGVPIDEAEALVHDVFLSCLDARKGTDIRHPEAWFYAAIRNACADYWRKEGRVADEEPPERVIDAPDYVARIAAHEILAALTPRERRVLWMQRGEGYRVREIALRIHRSVSFTEKLLRQARLRAAEVAGVADSDDTHRRRVGRGARLADTYPDWCGARRMIRAHVRPLRGTSLPRTPARPAVLSAHGRAARKVHGEFPAADGLLQGTAGAT